MLPTAQAVLDRLYAEDRAQRDADLPSAQRCRNLSPESGRLLSLLARAMDAKLVLEIGSSNGVSTIWLGDAVRATGGNVIGTEIIPDRAAEANANIREAGLADHADVVGGDAAATLTHLSGTFDLVFIDAEKEDYADHFRRAFPLLRPGGVIVADNVTSHDITDYQELVRNHPDCETITLPFERGLELTLKVR